MSNDHIPAAFSMLIEEFERTIHEINRDGARAFEEKRYNEIPLLTQKAKDGESFQSRIVALEDEWSSLSEQPKKQKDKKEKWTKQSPATPVAFHAACVARANSHLKTEFIKQTRSSFISKDGQIALVISISREHDNGNQHFCWFGFPPYQAEFLASKRRGYLLLGCGAPDRILLIPFEDFLPWSQKLNKTVREDDSYYSHIRIVTDDGGFRLKLEGRGNQVDVAKYQIKIK